MFEGPSSIREVVGKNSEEEKISILRTFEGRFAHQVPDGFIGEDREKKPEELVAISLANDWTNGLRRKYGLDDFDVPPQNVRVVDPLKWQHEGSNGFFQAEFQNVVIKGGELLREFAHRTCHELIHMKTWGTAHIPENRETARAHTIGLDRARRSDGKLYFTIRNEALTEELAIRFTRDTEQKPLFSEEVAETARLQERFPKLKELFSGEEYALKEADGQIVAYCFSYEQERRIFNMLVDGIYKRNQTTFQDREEVFEIFARAAFTDESQQMKELIEESFGRGTLGHLARFESDINLQEAFVTALYLAEGEDVGTIEYVRQIARQVIKESAVSRDREQIIFEKGENREAGTVKPAESIG